jgi:hypothetical protein
LTDLTELKTTQVGQRVHRLIPSRFPPIEAFGNVASPEDAAAVMELEGWTNDRLVLERLNRLPRNTWLFGQPNASVVMASLLHVAPSGMRFNGNELGAWYAGYAVETAIAEVAHHLRREAVFSGKREMRLQYRQYLSTLRGDFVDIRGHQQSRPELYDPSDYAAAQRFGEEVRASGRNGIVYNSVRHQSGISVAAYIPRDILDVTATAHFEITAPIHGKIFARIL